MTPSRLHEVASDAPWRSAPLSHWDLYQRWVKKGLTPSPLFSAPCVSSDTMVLDWLHIADLGVTCDFGGNLFSMTSCNYPGGTHEERCTQLYHDICAFYKKEKVDSKLDMLTPTMIQAKGDKPPKLRAKAAEARYLVPFFVEHADKMLGDSELERTVKEAARALASCYSCLSKDNFDPNTLRDASRRFSILTTALSKVATPPAWRRKPKGHLFQEMNEVCCEVRPSCTWTYRDEDFGGAIAALARRRVVLVLLQCAVRRYSASSVLATESWLCSDRMHARHATKKATTARHSAPRNTNKTTTAARHKA